MRYLLSISLTFCVLANLLSQEPPAIHKYIGFSVEPLVSNILADTLSQKSGFGFSASGTIGFCGKYIGFETGIGYSQLSNKLILDKARFTQNNVVDSEGETYQSIVDATNVTETQTLGSISVPLTLKLLLPLKENKISLFMDVGTVLYFPIVRQYTSNGTYTYSGYYPSLWARLSDLPDYGFPTNYSFKSTSTFETKSLFVSFKTNIGVRLHLTDKSSIKAGGTIIRSIGSLTKSNNNPESLSSKPNVYSSLMNRNNPASVFSYGLHLGYCFTIGN
jgi:hypothetical protein